MWIGIEIERIFDVFDKNKIRNLAQFFDRKGYTCSLSNFTEFNLASGRQLNQAIFVLTST